MVESKQFIELLFQLQINCDYIVEQTALNPMKWLLQTKLGRWWGIYLWDWPEVISDTSISR